MKKIISVGFDIPGYADNYKPYTSSQSLLDADIVVFEPDFSNYSYYESYQGKPSFSENESFRLKEDTRHWHSEISTALQDGKTVFVFMGQYEEVFVHTGQKQYSGTGRNTRVTNIVSSYNNYEFLPVDIPSLIPKEGKDNSAINIDKFRQLESNIQEDLQREDVSDPAIGILFGNGFRVIPPKKREEQFTDKCIKNAKRLNVVLVRTPDLFEVARYARENSDKNFVKECRKAILESRGKIVKFPEIGYSKSKKKPNPTHCPYYFWNPTDKKIG